MIPVFRGFTVILGLSCLSQAYCSAYLIIFPVDKGQLKLELGGVDTEHSSATLAVQTVDTVALDSCDVDGQVQSPDNAVVTATINTTDNIVNPLRLRNEEIRLQIIRYISLFHNA